jgi:hypothetical protein
MDLIMTMNDSMHFQHKEPITVVGKPLIDPSSNNNYPLTKDQYKKIADNVITDKTFNFTYKGKEKAITSKFNNDSTTIKKSIEKLLNTWSPENGTKAFNKMVKRIEGVLDTKTEDMSNFLFYLVNVSLNLAIDSNGYFSLPDDA